MHNTLPFRLCALVALAAATPAEAAERGFSLTSFDTIRVEGPYQVEVRTASGTSGKAIGARDAVDRVDLQIIGRTLVVRANRASWNGKNDADTGPAKILLTTSELKRITLVGAGSLSIDRLRGASADIALQGSGRISIGTAALDRVVLHIAGSGIVTLAGTARSVDAKTQGAARIDAPGFTASDLVLGMQGDGDVTISASRSAKVSATGAGNIIVLGRPACTVNALGAGSVRCGG